MIPATPVQAICQLPEVASALNTITSSHQKLTKNSDEILSCLDRASQIFAKFGQDEFDAVLSLLAHCYHEISLYEKSTENLTLLRKNVESSTNESDKEQRLWNVIQWQAKSQWFHGSFGDAERFAAEATEFGSHIND